MSIESRLTALESARPGKTTPPPVRLTLRELDAELARIDRKLNDNEARRIAKLKARQIVAQLG